MEPTSTLVIGRIEKREGGTVVHVSVLGLRVRNPSSDSGVASEVAHMPFSEQALLASITELNGQSSPDIDFESGYEQWLKGTGGEGAFALTVAEAISNVEETVTEGFGLNVRGHS